ncbi:MAG TPA: glycosyltransferase [Bacteroidales bacterium]|nr:glycosyltransferase [Bacteroidales bacterium]
MQSVQEYLNKNKVEPVIAEIPTENLGIIIVIPCFNEPALVQTLQSVWECHKPQADVEVIIVINDAETTSKEIKLHNVSTYIVASHWATLHNEKKLHFYPIYYRNLPSKHAGVGLARKIGMDQAVWRFVKANNTKGIIVNLDADSLCDRNYLTAIEHHFLKYPKTPGASIYFEHPVENEPSTGIVQYELHLRYLNQALRFIGHPHAFHTVGSSFAVRLDAYVKQGGMNKRQAGEDFYFIQKIIWLGNFTEINTTRVIPSSRISNRVPFGTGAALKKLAEENADTLLSYQFLAFLDLAELFRQKEKFYTSGNSPENVVSTSPILLQFLKELDFTNEMASIRKNTSVLQSFINRFFRWFDAFSVIKFLNYSHSKYYSKKPVSEEALKLLNAIGIHTQPGSSKELLEIFRRLDRNGKA